MYLVPLVLFAVLGSACQVKIDQSTYVEDDGSGQVVVDVLLDEELRNLSGFDGAESAFEVAGGVPEGFVVEDLVVGDFAGARATRSFADLDELSVILQDAAGAGLAEEVSVVREGNEYRYVATIGDLEAAADGVGFVTSDTFDDFFDITLAVHLPGNVIDHNADFVRPDGTLVWRIGFDDSGSTIAATSRVAIGWVPMAIGLILLVGLIGSGALIFLKRRSKSEKETGSDIESSESPTI